MKLYYLLFISVCILTGCKKSGSQQPTSQAKLDSLNATIEIPQKINIYPAITNNGRGPGRILINTKEVGNVSVNISMIFDTGSAGVVLNALSIFPSTLVDENGFKFKPGQDTITYNGITIKNIKVEKIYGASTSTVTRKIGNLGFAKISVGDASGTVQTLTMPILFYYQTLVNDVVSQTAMGSVFGVNSSFNSVVNTQDSTNNFKLVSPFKYLIYKNLTAGYKLDAVVLNGCDIAVSGSCQPQQLLTVGLNQNDASTYQMNALSPVNAQSQTNLPSGFPAYPNYQFYNSYIMGALVGNEYRKRTVNVLLDTGTPGINLNLSKDSIKVENYPLIMLTLPSKDNYTYNYNTANFATAFNRSNTASVYGVYFFTAFSFLEDYKNGTRGVKMR